jgi:hypothetical protein
MTAALRARRGDCGATNAPLWTEERKRSRADCAPGFQIFADRGRSKRSALASGWSPLTSTGTLFGAQSAK